MSATGPIAWSYDLSIKPTTNANTTSNNTTSTTSTDTTTTISLINYVQTIDLTHSLFQKCMTLELVLLDASLLLNPRTVSDLINQKAALFLTIRSASDDQALIMEREFRVLEVKEGTSTVGLTARQHRIIAADPIAVRNLNAYVSEAYDTNQLSVADIGKSIFDRYLSERDEQELTADESKALTTTSAEHLIFPYVRPFHAMDMCARLARSTDDAQTGGDLWIFFQNPAGVFFRCLRKMIEEQLENPPHRYFLQPDSMRTGDPARDAYRIEHFKQLQLGSYPALARAGASKAGLSEFNIITGDVTTTLYSADDQSNNATQLVSSTVSSDDVESPTHIRVQSDLAAYGFNESADRDKYNITTVQKAMLSQSSLNIQVRGNVALKAGDLIQVEAPIIAGVNRNAQLDPHLSGRYLITTVKHLIPNSQDFITVLDLVREGSDVDASAPSVVAEEGSGDSVIYDVNGNRVG